ncbi:uncharacterized protein A1O9_08238 [Exophiala aquamarina CBS 119918]|uniref:Uncharacterized protein n=1 Tax=Exophiala aquamarina CBS 119918 TaxID=1182545 RepID=A0A072P866_9EURO|nr:uncharacterized protein A1O9_08238 [Exophiala aquamarina CBS 119918]KEF55488.1 hypothetical protein A1O9_08238 [Exophiala aquamarina CBS 119918]
MARKLPWAVNDDPQAKRSRTSLPPACSVLNKEYSITPLDKDENHDLPSNRGRALETSARKGVMRSGYDKDDVYIMVEDEFQTVAQSYTAHLHHAEYKRLMREARTVPPKDLPEPTSPMSSEAKRRLQGAALQKRQGDVLHQVLGKRSPEQDEEDKMNNLWSGTSLAPLMAQGSQQKTSLVGLERISSSTRAGSGYSRPKSSGAHFRVEEASESEELTSIGTGGRSRRADQAQRAHRASRHTSKTLPPRSRVLPTQKQGDEPHRPTSAVLDLDEQTTDRGDSRNKWSSQTTRPKGPASSSNFMNRKSEKEKERQSRLGDVPLFII